MAAVCGANGCAITLNNRAVGGVAGYRRRRLSVCHFILDHRVGGPHVYVRSLREAMREDYRWAPIITAGRGPLTDFALINLRRWWRPLYVVEVVLNALFIIKLWISTFRSSRVDVFHVHGVANIAPIIAARVIGVPVVWHVHEAINELSLIAKCGKHILSRKKGAVVAVNNGAERVYSIERIRLVPAPVDTKFWSRDDVSAGDEDRHWPTNDSPRFVMVGNLSPIEGLDSLLRALETANERVYLKIVGADLETHARYIEGLKKEARRIERMNSKVAIEFYGWRSQHEVREIMAGADFFVMPSLSEAGPLVLFEAMSMGLVCIASDTGAVRELLTGSQVDFIANPGDSRALAACIRKGVSLSKEMRAEIGARNREAVSVARAPMLIRELMRQVYDELLS